MFDSSLHDILPIMGQIFETALTKKIHRFCSDVV